MPEEREIKGFKRFKGYKIKGFKGFKGFKGYKGYKIKGSKIIAFPFFYPFYRLNSFAFVFLALYHSRSTAVRRRMSCAADGSKTDGVSVRQEADAQANASAK